MSKKSKLQLNKLIEKKNLPFFISQIISLTFVIPFVAIIWTVIYLTWAFNSPTTVQNAEWILSTDWLEGGSFLFFAFVWYLVTQGILVFFYIYFHFVDKTDFGTRYGSTLLIFNGFVYSQFLVLKRITFGKRKNTPSPIIVKRAKGLLSRTAIIAIIPFQFTLIGITFNHQIYTPTTLKEIRLSTDPGEINVIEIFSDGIDEYVFDIIEDSEGLSESFKDFTFYENFVTTGTNTVRSYNTLTGGFKHSMLWQGHEFGFEVLKDVVPERMNAIDLDNKYIIHPKFDVENDSGVIGDEETDESVIRTANWTQAKDKYSGTFGTTYSPEYLKHKLMQDLWAYGPDRDGGSHVMLADHLYHFPYSTAEDGSLGFTAGTRETGAHATASIVSQSVQSIKDFDVDAYNNSIILVYGDHASHALPIETWGEPHDDMVKNRPVAAIKYPDVIKESFDVVDDRTFFSPLLQDVIASNVADPTAGGTLIETDERFSMDQTFFLERPEGILLHDFNQVDGEWVLQSLDSDLPGNEWLHNGWVSWEDIYDEDKYLDYFLNDQTGYMTQWYNDINFEVWDPSVYEGGNNA